MTSLASGQAVTCALEEVLAADERVWPRMQSYFTVC